MSTMVNTRILEKQMNERIQAGRGGRFQDLRRDSSSTPGRRRRGKDILLRRRHQRRQSSPLLSSSRGAEKDLGKSETSSLGRHAIAGKAGHLSSRSQKFPPPGESRSFGSGQPFALTRRAAEGPTVSLFPGESRFLPRPRRFLASRSTLHTNLSGSQALLHCFSKELFTLSAKLSLPR